jgi:hypothetical protein
LQLAIRQQGRHIPHEGARDRKPEAICCPALSADAGGVTLRPWKCKKVRLMSVPPEPLWLPPEFRLAAACCGASSDHGKAERIRDSVVAVRDWPKFLRVAQRHRVMGLVQRALGEAAGIAVPPAVMDALHRAARAQVQLNLALAAEACRLDQVLAATGIDAVFLKGATLAQLIYGDIGRRHSRDVDVLVAPEAVVTTLAVLEQAGYRCTQPFTGRQAATYVRFFHHFEMVHVQRRTRVEVHWRLSENPLLMPDIPAREDWVAVAFAGGHSLRTFGKEDLFCYLCAHGARHAWYRLKWLADIAAIVAGETEAGLVNLLNCAKDKGVIRAAAQGLRLTSLLLEPDPSPLSRVLSTLPQDKAVHTLVRIALDLLMAGEGETEPHDQRFSTTRVNLSHYRLRSDWRYWLAEMRFNLVAPHDWQSCPLPPALAPLYPLLRVPLWLHRRLRRGT